MAKVASATSCGGHEQALLTLKDIEAELEKDKKS